MSKHTQLTVAAAAAATVFAVVGGLASDATGRALNSCGPCPVVATLLPTSKQHGSSEPALGLLRAVLISHPPQRSQMDFFNQHDTLSWRLTFQNLTGPASAAQIRVGRPGATGPVAITLCAPCKSGAHGNVALGRPLAIAVNQGPICVTQPPCSLAEPSQVGAYVEIRTSAHPQGEIRGQLRDCFRNQYKHRGACTPPGYPLR